MSKQITIKDFEGNPLNLIVKLGLYRVYDFMGKPTSGLAILFEDETGEPYTDLTVSFGEFIGMKNAAYIDTNNCDFADQILGLGFAKDTGLTKHSGFCTYPLWIFDEAFLKELDKPIYDTYCKDYENEMKMF